MHFSSSDPRAGFQPAPSGRDTMDIVSSCASTLITCIYSSVHFNIPRGQSQRLVFKEKLRSRNFWLDLWVKVTFWLLAIFSPEMVVLHAFYEHMVAKRDVKWMKEKGHEDWSMTLAFFADMGGFVLEGKDMEVHSGFAIHEELFRNKNEPGAIDCKALEYDIADRTKADLLFKLLTTLQIFRFVVGTAVRLIVSLPVAPLETITCAYVACTLVYYGLWFKKPYNVNERIVVKINPRLKRARPISEGDIPKPGFQELEIEDVGVKGRKRSWSRALKDFFEPPMGETDRLHGSTHMYQTSPCKFFVHILKVVITHQREIVPLRRYDPGLLRCCCGRSSGWACPSGLLERRVSEQQRPTIVEILQLAAHYPSPGCVLHHSRRGDNPEALGDRRNEPNGADNDRHLLRREDNFAYPSRSVFREPSSRCV